MNKLIISTLLYLMAQALVWFQINGQFIWVWFKDHPLILSLFGIPISYLYIVANQYAFEAFGGTLWPGRLLGFGLGMFVFAICANIFLGEGLNTKTIISLILACVLVCIQVFYK